MDALSLMFTVGAIIIGAIIAWTYTKPGKKWLEDL